MTQQNVTSPPPNTQAVVSAATQQQVALINAAGQQNKDNTPKRLHVSNIPFRFRDPDLRSLFGVRLNTNFYNLTTIIMPKSFCEETISIFQLPILTELSNNYLLTALESNQNAYHKVISFFAR